MNKNDSGFSAVEQEKVILAVKAAYFKLCSVSEKRLTKTDLLNYLVAKIMYLKESKLSNPKVETDFFYQLLSLDINNLPNEKARLKHWFENHVSNDDKENAKKEIRRGIEFSPFTSLINLINKNYKPTNEVLNFAILYFQLDRECFLNKDLAILQTELNYAVSQFDISQIPKGATETILDLVKRKLRASYAIQILIGLVLIAILYVVFMPDKEKMKQEIAPINFESFNHLIENPQNGFGLYEISNVQNDGGVQSLFLRLDSYGLVNTFFIDEVVVKVHSKEKVSTETLFNSNENSPSVHFRLNTMNDIYSQTVFSTQNNSLLPNSSNVFNLLISKEGGSLNISFMYKVKIIGHWSNGQSEEINTQEFLEF
jgi:competence protein ComGC|uniref:hypothetical protein n=2 Tax=Roseivirga sp. TaxID=1964215 RepID=UPI004047EB7D